jgi:hypothetical protein
MELMVLANHRKAIRSEIASYIEYFRDLEHGTAMLAMKARGIDTESFPPVVMSMIMGNLARMIVVEKGLGITRGHDETRAFVERCLDQFELPASERHPEPDGSRGPTHIGRDGVTSDTNI